MADVVLALKKEISETSYLFNYLLDKHKKIFIINQNKFIDLQ